MDILRQLQEFSGMESTMGHFNSYIEDHHLEINTLSHYEQKQTEGKRAKSVMCTYCMKKFWNRADCQGHINSQHLHQKPFVCRKCLLPFSYKSSLKSHEVFCQLTRTGGNKPEK